VELKFRRKEDKMCLGAIKGSNTSYNPNTDQHHELHTEFQR